MIPGLTSNFKNVQTCSHSAVPVLDSIWKQLGPPAYSTWQDPLCAAQLCGPPCLWWCPITGRCDWQPQLHRKQQKKLNSPKFRLKSPMWNKKTHKEINWTLLTAAAFHQEPHLLPTLFTWVRELQVMCILLVCSGFLPPSTNQFHRTLYVKLCQLGRCSSIDSAVLNHRLKIWLDSCWQIQNESFMLQFGQCRKKIRIMNKRVWFISETL